MAEPVLDNRSGFVASVLPILDREGAPCRIVIVKATYALAVPGSAGMPCLAEVPRDVRMGDELWGAPEVADIRLPGDFYAAKPGTDFVLSGHAVPLAGARCDRMEVGMRVADRIKVLRVHGPRVWRRSLTSVVPGASGPVVPTPLAWSKAYGGIDLSQPDRPLEEARNPVGSGMVRRPEQLIGRPAPQIESPSDPIGAAGERVEPAGCAALGRHFTPRREMAGTHDEAWLRSGYPARPADYREAHENFAPPDFVFAEPLRGGEIVRVAGVHAAGAIDFRLPRQRVVIQAEIDGLEVERRPHLDTVVLDSDAMLLEMVWRTLLRCPPKMRGRFASVRVRAKEFIS